MPVLCHCSSDCSCGFQASVDSRSRYNLRQGAYDVRLLINKTGRPRPKSRHPGGNPTLSTNTPSQGCLFLGLSPVPKPAICMSLVPKLQTRPSFCILGPHHPKGPKALGVTPSLCCIHTLNQSLCVLHCLENHTNGTFRF